MDVFWVLNFVIATQECFVLSKGSDTFCAYILASAFFPCSRFHCNLRMNGYRWGIEGLVSVRGC